MRIPSILVSVTTSLVLCACSLAPTEEERLQNARILIDQREYERAWSWLEPLRHSTNPDYYFLLAILGLERNVGVEEAVDLLLPLAKNNEIRAYAPLARGFRRLDQYEDSAIWLQKSADAGNTESMFELAGYYWEGWGVARNRDRTFELLDLAAQRESSREDAIRWRGHYEFRIEMETGSETPPDGACLVYFETIFRHGSTVTIERLNAVWCDESLDPSIEAMALDEVDAYEDRELRALYDQLKATFRKHAGGYSIDGVIRYEGRDFRKFSYSVGPGGVYSSICRPREIDCP